MSQRSFRHALVVSGLVAGTAFGIGLFGGMRPASAGEAGAAGSAAFTINAGGQVTGAAISAAVGSNSAAAGSYNDGTANAAYSSGTSGTSTMTMTSGVVSNMATANPVATNQANTLDASVVQMDADAGTLNAAGSN
ncbi:hypothetical protein ACN4EK_00305 [Pantanalinema rosaneae CENA516]|uniref:hypothetical protein n=1 Tax=Pantanalinema rosaneae TaxID=1620701 RepID=UPI003D6EC1CF